MTTFLTSLALATLLVQVAPTTPPQRFDYYAHVLEIQHATWAKLGDHPRGELLFGLAEGSARLGDQPKARMYFERLLADAPSSGQAPRAKAWIDTGTVPKANGFGCVGCHK